METGSQRIREYWQLDFEELAVKHQSAGTSSTRRLELEAVLACRVAEAQAKSARMAGWAVVIAAVSIVIAAAVTLIAGSL